MVDGPKNRARLISRLPPTCPGCPVSFGGGMAAAPVGGAKLAFLGFQIILRQRQPPACGVGHRVAEHSQDTGKQNLRFTRLLDSANNLGFGGEFSSFRWSSFPFAS